MAKNRVVVDWKAGYVMGFIAGLGVLFSELRADGNVATAWWALVWIYLSMILEMTRQNRRWMVRIAVSMAGLSALLLENYLDWHLGAVFASGLGTLLLVLGFCFSGGLWLSDSQWVQDHPYPRNPLLEQYLFKLDRENLINAEICVAAGLLAGVGTHYYFGWFWLVPVVGVVAWFVSRLLLILIGAAFEMIVIH